MSPDRRDATSELDDDGVERLLYDLLRDIPEFQNVQWLMQTRAPDRGRDLSLERVPRDITGSNASLTSLPIRTATIRAVPALVSSTLVLGGVGRWMRRPG